MITLKIFLAFYFALWVIQITCDFSFLFLLHKVWKIKSGLLTSKIDRDLKINFTHGATSVIKRIHFPGMQSLIATTIIGLFVFSLCELSSNKVSELIFNNSYKTNNILDDIRILFQTQIAIGAGALPILIFIMGLGLGEKIETLASNRIEIFVKYTYVFPITIVVWEFFIYSHYFLDFSICANAKQHLFVFTTLSILSCLMTVFIFYKTLKLIFFENQMKEQGIRLLEEKLEESIDYSARVKKGRALLMTELSHMDINFEPYFFRQKHELEIDNYLLTASSKGSIIDINFYELSEFQKYLNEKRKNQKIAEISSTDKAPDIEDDPKLPTEPDVQFLVTYAQDVNVEKPLILLRRIVFERIENSELDYFSRKIFVIGDENA
jgi:hypothetical protein